MTSVGVNENYSSPLSLGSRTRWMMRCDDFPGNCHRSITVDIMTTRDTLRVVSPLNH